MPLVSVCIPVYNYARYLPEAIESVLGQRFGDFELLVIDNHSTDRTMEIALEYAARDPRIRVLANLENLGMVPNWNRCLREARGEYIKFLFADDLLTSPYALGRMVEILEKERNVSLVASARTVVDEESRVVETLSCFPDGARIPGTELISNCLEGLSQQHNPIGEPSVVMFRRESAGRGFNLRYRQLVDVEMWFHLLEQGMFAYIGEPLCAFRSHGEQQSMINQRDFYIDDAFFLIEDYLGRPYTGDGRFAKSKALFRLAYLYWKILGDRKTVLRKISAHISPVKFFLMLALHRVTVPFTNLARSFAKRRRAWK